MSEIDLYRAMSTTRAVRRLRADPIPDVVLRRVLEAATWAPSGGNRQPWRVIVLRDPEKKRVLRDLYRESWRAYTRARSGEYELLPGERRDRVARTLASADHLADHFHEAPVICVFCFDPNGLAITDAALERPSVVGGGSLYPAVQNLLLACRAEGLGCVLTTLLVAHESEVRKLLEIPEPWCSYAFVPIGYPVGAGHGPLGRRPVERAVYLDRFGQSYRWS